MRVVDLDVTVEAIGAALRSGTRADYVYMYPPRQAYGPLDRDEMHAAVDLALASRDPINLYVHVPFCRQICSYCNLFAIAGDQGDSHDHYMETVLTEFDHFASPTRGRVVDTLYIGGGTPSLVDPELLAKLTAGLAARGDFALSAIPEVALEVAPDTVTAESVAGFRAAGINRINLGVQSWNDGELHGIGRKHDSLLHETALEIALDAGFSNVCVDLIYGLPGQTGETWVQSLHEVIARRPQTICCYALTLRPKTGYAQKGFGETDDETQYRRYDAANELLTQAGYVQETHVRWVLPGQGGYRQKVNHWAGQDILGLGAGARSYLSTVDIRNGYSVTHRVAAYRGYFSRVAEVGHGMTDGFLMTDDERLRKALILGLAHVDLALLRERFGPDAVNRFDRYFSVLDELGLATRDGDRVQLTALGIRHRDVIVQPLFSEPVRSAVRDFDYDE